MLKNQIEIIIFCLTIFIVAYFHNASFASQNSRLDLIYSVVERDANLPIFSIDKYIYDPIKGRNTNDWSYYNNHYYSNKAPGFMLLGVPVYFVIKTVEDIVGINSNYPPVEFINAYLINFFVSILPLAISAVLFFRLLLLFKFSRPTSFKATLVSIFCTMYFPYNTHLWGNTTATSLVVMAFYLLHRKGRYSLFFAGFFLALATITEYLTFLTTFLLFIYYLNKTKKYNSILSIVLGAIPVAIFIMYYHYVCFGSVFATSIKHVNPVFVSKDLFMNTFSLPSFNVLWELTFGLKRGIFVAMPILILGFFGIFESYKKHKQITIYSVVIIFLYLVVNSSFNGWHGGSTVMARYLIPTIPFFMIIITPVFDAKHFLTRSLAKVLVLISFLNMLVVTSISPLIPQDVENPLYGHHYQKFLNGELAPFKFPIRLQGLDSSSINYSQYSSWNFGTLIGLEGVFSILPLILLVTVLFYYLHRKRYLSS